MQNGCMYTLYSINAITYTQQVSIANLIIP